MHNRIDQFVAKCPKCGQPHHYSEVTFSAVNDHGYWAVDCDNCRNRFAIIVNNPRESGGNFYVAERHEDERPPSTLAVATNVLTHNIDLNHVAHVFNYAAVPLYVCAQSGTNLEEAALAALTAEFTDVKGEYANAINLCLAGQTPDFTHVVIHIDVACTCGAHHVATYYAPFLANGAIQETASDYLLAGVSGVDLSDRLDGLFSKSDVMALFEKLVIRWGLTAKQILLAVPFVGHQYLTREDKMATWTWLLSLLDADRSIFITRPTTLSAYKVALEDVDGLKHAMLAEYGLENRIIAANMRKRDFHAKFFIGLDDDACEVLSGSANLVTGPSIENISFRAMSAPDCQRKYIAPLNLTLPSAKPKGQFALISKTNDVWRGRNGIGDPLTR